eukprot:16825-Heterococcus_DN1.PRE.3
MSAARTEFGIQFAQLQDEPQLETPDGGGLSPRSIALLMNSPRARAALADMIATAAQLRMLAQLTSDSRLCCYFSTAFSELRGSAKVAPPLPPRSQVNVASAEAAAAAAAAAVKPAPAAFAASAPAAQPAAAAKVPDAAAKAAPMASAAPAPEGKQQDNQAKPAADNFFGFELHEHLGIAALQIVGFVIACAIFAACYLALAILKSPVLLSRAIGLC